MFTAASVRELLAEKVLRGPKGRAVLAMPDDAELRTLARCLAWLRLEVEQDHGIEQPMAALAAQTLRHLDGAAANVTEMIEMATRFKLPELTVLREAERQINQARWARGLAREVPSSVSWRHYAVALMGDFFLAMQPANSGRDYGAGHNGPLVRYIAAVAPMLTGETPTPDSVATRLKLMRRSGEWVAPDGRLIRGKTGQGR